MFSIDNALNKAENLLKSGNATPAVNSMVQSANNILSQSWNINFTYLPEKFRKQLLAQADRIAKLEKQFNVIKSRPAIAKINTIYNNIDQNGNCTQKINNLQEGIKKILVEAEKIYDLDERRTINAKVELIEHMGPATLFHCLIKNTKIIIKLPGWLDYKLEEEICDWHPNARAWAEFTPKFAEKYIK